MTQRGVRTRTLGVLLPVVLVLTFFNPDWWWPTTTSTTTSTTTAGTTTASRTTAAARATIPTACRTPARKGIWPVRAKVQHVGKRIPVLALGRDRYGVPREPPLTSSGKRVFGWDKKGPKPGSRRGNVRFNAHTWPDGSALGNRLLANLWVGQLIVVKNSYGKVVCYRVTKRLRVLPRSYEARVNYYSTTGKPKLAIVVCSPPRLGPGNWKYRTIWYARPVTS
ncbi:MAG TPA: class F sortase [Marmoricola sp.]|nr:class F sortase [Marmoricola sp.]